MRNFRDLINALRNKGILETLNHVLKIIVLKLRSVLFIALLRLRSYDIDWSVSLSAGSNFFQSHKHAILIKKNTRIGRNTRISAGFDGKIQIGKNVLIDDASFVMAQEKIIIGNNTWIAAGSFITDFNHRYKDNNKLISEQGYDTKPIVIGENVWVGAHSVLLPGVNIGDRVVIGAGSIVTKNIPANSVAVGNPARVIKRI